MAEMTIAELANAGALSFGDGYRTKRSEHGTPGYRILRVADVADGHIDFDGPDFISQKYERAIGSKLSQPGDVLLTTKGTVGRVAIYPKRADRVAYSPQLCYFRIIDASIIHHRFLAYWFKSEAFRIQASHRANNTDMAAYINLGDIASLTIELPTITQQRAIAEVLGALDDKIAANTKLIRLADTLAESLLLRQVSGGTVELSAIADVIMGSSPPGSSYNELGLGVPFYQGVRDFGTRFPSRRVWTDRPGRMASPKDTLISVRAPVGRTNFASEDLCIGRGLAALRSTTARPMTLFHQVRAAGSAWAPYEAEGTVFGAINRSQLEGIHVPIVSDAAAVELEARLAEIEGVITTYLHESEVLATTRDELLPLLMSGKIRVKDAETQVEEVL